MSISSAKNFRRDWIDKIDRNVLPFVEYIQVMIIDIQR